MKNRNKYHAQSQKQAYIFLAPSMLILTVFVFIPLIGALVISVMNIDIYMNNISFAGFGNYLKMFHDSRIGNATFNSFYFALAEVPLQVLMALLMLMLMIKNNRFHKFLRTVFYLPYVCSMTAISIMWSMLLNTNYGMLPYLFKRIGVDFPNVLTSTTWAMPVVILITDIHLLFYLLRHWEYQILYTRLLKWMEPQDFRNLYM